MAELKAIRRTTVDEGLKGINPPPCPEGIPDLRWQNGYGVRQDLAWYRGHQAGIYDAYLTLRKQYPHAAKALIDAFDMNAEGVQTLPRK